MSEIFPLKKEKSPTYICQGEMIYTIVPTLPLVGAGNTIYYANKFISV